MGEGDAEVSAAFLLEAFLLFAAAGLGEVEAFFFVVVEEVVAASSLVLEVVVVDSFFCAQETTNATAIAAAMQDRSDLFIVMVLRLQTVQPTAKGQALSEVRAPGLEGGLDATGANGAPGTDSFEEGEKPETGKSDRQPPVVGEETSRREKENNRETSANQTTWRFDISFHFYFRPWTLSSQR